MVCTACVWSRAWSGLPCAAHRQTPPPRPPAAPARTTMLLPADRTDTADCAPRRPGHRLSDADAFRLLCDDIARYGETA